ncbi:MAG: DHHA1 domain-containing protein, partial [Anaerolineae bacterium]
HQGLRGFRPVLVHYGQVEAGRLSVGDTVEAVVDEEHRLDIMRNHTATHLLHKALREVLGGHARQSGSLVAPDRLRFDFTHMAGLTPEELKEIEQHINAKIRENLPVTAQVIDYDKAIAAGAVAIFGEKYGDRVRMVSIDNYTKELCGGTHLRATGEIGLFHIVGEESIGAGLRRIEALTGRGAERYMQEALTTLVEVADRLQVPPTEVGDRVASLLESLKQKEREVARLRREKARSEVDSLLEKVTEVKGVKLLAAEVRVDDIESLREMTDWVRDRLGSAVVVLGAVLGDKPALVAAVTPDLVERGLRADWLAKEVANLVGGGGGGRPTLAQAGGRDASKLQEALAAVEGFLADRL